MKSMNSMKTMVEINMIFISSLRSILGKQWENNGFVFQGGALLFSAPG